MRLWLRLLLLVIFCANALDSATTARPRPRALWWTIDSMLADGWGGSCQWTHVAGKQRRMCHRDGALAILQAAGSLASQHCTRSFQYEPWNCSRELAGTDFLRAGKVYRETALLGAMAGAALTHAAARACAEGSAPLRCACRPGAVAADDPAAVRRAIRSGTCDDDLRAGRRFARNLLMLRALGDDPAGVAMRTNVEVGIKVASARTEEVCRCSGPSGSCAMKTCWRRAVPFGRVADALRSRYYRAVHAEPRNAAAARWRGVGRRARRVTAAGPLLWLEPSPDLCSATRGRTCRGDDNCARLCCLRGYAVRRVAAPPRYCRCRFRSLTLLYCDLCRVVRELRVCR